MESKDPLWGISIILMIIGGLMMLYGTSLINESMKEYSEEKENNLFSTATVDTTGDWVFGLGGAFFVIGFILIDYSKKYKNYISRQERKQKQNDVLYYEEYMKYKNKLNKK